MKKMFPLFALVTMLCGCAGGPPHDYYNPVVAKPPKFKGPPSIEVVDDLDKSKAALVADGYTVIGTSVYTGEQPKAVELKAQASRVHANKVIYYVSEPAPGTWNVHVGLFNGGHGGGSNVKIVYLGK